MRKAITISFIVLGLAYLGGAACAFFHLITWGAYLIIVAVVGGLASIIGLGAASMRSELREYSAETLKKLAETADEIENKKTQLKDTAEQIASLEYKKEELEVLVRKASLSLYYKEECERLYQKLLDLIHRESEINDVIVSIQQAESNLMAIDGEINDNKEIKDILATIQKAKSRQISNPLLRVSFPLLGTVLSYRLYDKHW